MADTVYKLTHTGKQIDSAIDNAVRSDAQILTSEQQTQARTNIGAASAASAADRMPTVISGNPLTVPMMANSITSLVLHGATTQTGTGDPSPTNIRPIYGVGRYDGKIVLDGSDDEAWKLNGTGDKAYFAAQLLPNSGTTVPMITSDFPTVPVSALNTVQGAGNWITSFYLRWKTLFSSVS